ncbi:MAG: DNA mismatch repair protein MutS [Methylococcaceae bacterium]|nr:DNA mismatch repair protein MutS [Methylococcaceae bacterium]
MSKKTLSEEDANLFRQSVGNVKIIESDTVLLQTASKPKPIPKSQTDEDENPFTESPVLGEQLRAEDSMSFLSTGLQKNVLKKLRRGYFGLDAELDLHGLNSREAKHHLQHFLHDCVEDGCRCVHIIHGKGYRSEDGFPILKNSVNIWLRQHNDVQAFCSASPREGGTGAVLVLLHIADKYK